MGKSQCFVSRTFLPMGNCEPAQKICCGGVLHEVNPLGVEQLEHAIRKLDVNKVRAILEMGVDPNTPIDDHDHTAMDVLMCERNLALREVQKSKKRGEMSG